MSTANPTLPRELEREIACIAALSYPTMLPSLLLVARRFAEWVEPLLYHVVPVDDTHVAHACMRAIQSKPASFLRCAVRHMYLDSCWENEAVARALRLCTGVWDLAVTPNYPAAALLPIISDMRLRRFSGYLCSVFGGTGARNVKDGLERGLPFLAGLTHLDLYDDPEDAGLYRALPVLGGLTHLALNHSVSASTLRWLLDLDNAGLGSGLGSGMRLEVLVILWHIQLRDAAVEYGTELFREAPDVVRDPRFVMVVYQDGRVEWEVGASGRSGNLKESPGTGNNFWMRADKWVGKRRAREIEDTACLCLELKG